MQYILIHVEGLGPMYQEVYQGRVTRFVSEDGTQSYSELPAGMGSWVLDASPPAPEWALPDPVPDPVPEPAPEPAPPPKRLLTKNAFVARFGMPAFIATLSLAKVDVVVEAQLFLLNNATPDADGNSVDLDDPRTVAGVRYIEPLLIAQGVVAEGWADGVLNA